MRLTADNTLATRHAPSQRRRKKRYIFMCAIVGVCLALVAGFFRFIYALDNLTPQTAENVDAIVVLTGGKNRVAESLELLNAHQGARLLISGVNPTTSLEQLIALSPDSREMLQCCVDLGREARSTVGNAWETRRWVEAGGYQNVLLVTSNYHMPRSLMEMRRALPRLKFYAHPVAHEGVSSEWWRDTVTTELLVREYVKYLATLVRYRLHPEHMMSPSEPIGPLQNRL